MYRKLIPGRATRPLATTAAAALLAGTVISGYGASSAAAATTPGAATTTTSTAPASLADATTTPTGTLNPPTASGTCALGAGQWPGVVTLEWINYQLQQLAGDEGIYGPGSTEVTSDDLAVSTDETNLSQTIMPLMPLPDPWTQAIMNQVLLVDTGSSQDQVQTAADAASSLAGQISQLCYTPPPAPALTSPGLA